jgi:hypothetical protein
MKFYAGIGSRSLPDKAVVQLMAISAWLASAGWGLRTGGASGADYAFWKGAGEAGGHGELHLPWLRFNQHLTVISARRSSWKRRIFHDNRHLAISAEYHPRWSGLSQGVRRLMGRNASIILGSNPDDKSGWSKMVVCYTRDGQASGGTGHGIRIAQGFGIPVFNIGNPNVLAHLKNRMR